MGGISEAFNKGRGKRAGFPGSSDSKESASNAGDLSLIPGSERSPGEGNGNPLQYSCLGNPMNRGAWRATVVTKELDTTERLKTAKCVRDTWYGSFSLHLKKPDLILEYWPI